MDWMLLFANLINAVLVLAAVQALKLYVVPWLNTQVPWILPIIAMGIGPLMVLATEYLVGLIGYPIDLSPIVGVFVGGTAVAFHQVGKQYSRAT
jgi:hypothetical protein